MHLLDLPLEIFRHIIDMYFDSISYMMPCDMKNLQLVNRFFHREVARTACNMHHHLALDYCPAHYLERWTFSKYGNNYLGNTIKNVSSQVMKHNRSSEAKTSIIDYQRYRISLLVSRAAIDFMVNGLFRVSSVLRREKYIPCNYHPCPSDIDFVTRLDAHGFSQSMRTEFGQRGDAPEHVLSAAAYLGDISLVGHLLAQGVDVNARSNIFGPPLRNAALRGHLEIVRLLLDNGANADDGCLPGTEEGWQVVEGQHHEKPSFEKWIPNTTDLPFFCCRSCSSKRSQRGPTTSCAPGIPRFKIIVQLPEINYFCCYWRRCRNDPHSRRDCRLQRYSREIASGSLVLLAPPCSILRQYQNHFPTVGQGSKDQLGIF